MAILSKLPRSIALAGATSTLFLSSCALPTEEGWNRIRTQGLITYLSNPEPRESHIARKNTESTRQAPAPVTPPLPTVNMITKSDTPKQTLTIPTPNKAGTAQSVPSLPGFVRSPYTNPPRLVDVKGSKPGATMICPYTQRPFIIPGDYTNPSDMMASNEPATQPEPTVADSGSRVMNKQHPDKVDDSEPVKQQPVHKEPKKEEPAKPQVAKQQPVKQQPTTVASNNGNKPTNLASVAPSMPLEKAPQVKEQPPVKELASTPPTTPATKPAVQEIPYGVSIPGRPGFVNSPFAAKHQLVDVTGLPTGMEVKCPYTGKLFRVPPMDVAAQKPTANPAATESVEKK